MPAFKDPEIYRDILDGLQIGVSVLDLQRNIVFWSDGAEQITGYSRMDVLGHSCLENILLHCNQSSCEMCAERCPIAAALHDAKPVEAMSFIHHHAGHRMQVHTWTIPLRDKQGSIIGVIQTFEGEFAVAGPEVNNRSMKERGCLDEVSGLPNQVTMQAYLREAMGMFDEFQLPFGIIDLEIPELSAFRARYGEVAARSIVQVLARTLRNTVWPTDFVGRWGESGFMVILSGCEEDALQSVCQRILGMMANATIRWWGEELSVTVSINRSIVVSSDTVESLLHRLVAPSGNLAVTTRRAAAGAANSSGS